MKNAANSVDFRDMAPTDIDAGMRLSRASGWNQTERDWRLFLDLSPSGCRVAVKDGVVVGTVATLRFEREFGWVAMLLVDPVARGAGIGKNLLREALSLLEDMPYVRLDATPAGLPIYRSSGFHEEYEIIRMKRVNPVVVAGAAQAPHVRQMTSADLEPVQRMDGRVFGADRGTLLRALFQRAPHYCLVANGPEGLEGYALGRDGVNCDHLGPLCALRQEVARDLVTAALSLHPRRPFLMDVPSAFGRWGEWLESIGFTEERRLFRMCRGSCESFGEPGEQFAILGPEFG